MRLPLWTMLWAAALGVLTARSASADVATAGAYDLTSDARGPGGSSSSAQFEAITAVQPAAGAAESAGSYTYLSGFLNYVNSFYLLSLLPPTVEYVQNNQVYGVTPTQGIQAQFTSPVSSASLVAATTAYLLYDHQGNFLNQSVPVSLSGYNPASNSVLIVSSAGWQMGATYRLAVGGGAYDLTGDPLITGGTLTFHAQQDFSQNNVVASNDGSGSFVQLPPSTLPGLGFVVISSDPYNGGAYLTADVAAADAKALSNNGPQSVPVIVEYIKAFSPGGTPLSTVFTSPALLTMSYPAPGANGTISLPGVSAPIQQNTLSMWTLDETSQLWEKVPSSTLDTQTHQVQALVPHFSVYAAIATADTDVTDTYAFPVPWRPNGHDPQRYGLPYGQSDGPIVGGISFVNLPQQGELRIYTLTGEQIIALPMNGGNKLVWNGKNSSGSDVVSGTYLWLIDSNGNKKTGKLMIIR